jgi:hypothetical protein
LTSRPPPPLPDYPYHAGAPVVWEPWEQVRVFICGPRRRQLNTGCEHCADRGPAWSTSGLVDSRVRLAAHRCPGCGHLDVYDLGADWTTFTRIEGAADGDQLGLFPPAPVVQRRGNRR